MTDNLSNHSISEAEATSAEQLKAIIENINGGVSVVAYGSDGGVRLTYANDRYYEVFGYTKEQFLTELKNPHEVLHPDDYESAGNAIIQVRSTGKPATFRYRIIKRDGSIAWVRCSSSMSAIPGLGDKVMISVLTDITASMEAEQQTLVLGQRLDALMKNISNAVTAVQYRADGTTDFIFSNDLYYEMRGYTKEQYQKEVKSPFDLIHPDDIEIARSGAVGAFHLGETKRLQYRIICRDGHIKWVRVRLSVLSFPDVEGPVQLSIYSDITDMMEANDRLLQQRDQISEMVNAAPSGIAVIEVDPRDIPGAQKVIYSNDRFFSFSGFSSEERNILLEKDQLNFAYDEDIPALRAFTARICEGDINYSEDITVRCLTKGGGFRWMLLTGRLFQKYDNRCVISLSQVDVTARKEAEDRQRISEEMLRIAAETDKRAIILYDVKANTCHVESRNLFSAKFGETIENIPESLIDLGIAERESINALVSLFDRIRDGEKQVTVSLQLRTGANEYQWFECNAAVVFDAQGESDHAVLVFHNITEQRLKEAVFKKWQQSIDTRPKDSYTLFRCNLSKDASLDERDGNLLKIEFDADSMTFNARTKECVERYVYPDDREAYSTLLNSDNLLVMFYRGEHAAELEYREIEENGDVCWRKLTVEMVEYLHSTDIQAFLMYEDIDEEKKAALKAQEMAQTDPLTGALNRAAFSDKVEEYLAAEPSAQQALLMMDMDGFKQVNDSFGHAAGDQALLDITAVIRSLLDDGDLVCRLGGDEFLIFLHDIPYDAAIEMRVKKICEMTRKTFSQEVQISTSIGIAVYPRDGHDFDELYRRADNALYCVKNAGKNSFAFFSASEIAQGDTANGDLPSELPAVRAVSRPKQRMLIVDDNEVNRVTLSGLFESDYQIEIARNGTEAMIRLRHFGSSISIVLLDLTMPDMSGFEVLKRIQNNAELRTIPVIVVSADDETESSLKAIELGAADYVTKPVDFNLIRLRVRSAISKAENERLRAQNSYLQLQRDEEMKFHIVLESTGTVVVEYNWRNHVFIYDNTISKYIAGDYNNRSLWTVFLSDMVADSQDVKSLQNALLELANDKDKSEVSKLVRLMTPAKVKHWFRMRIYKKADDFGLAEKMVLTFNDVHEEVLADEKLRYQATRDGLTGLYNRAGFIEKATELIAAKAPGYYVMSCIDIQKFKVINDQYGTEKGDDILRQFANALLKLHGDGESICGRVTADNFVVLFPQSLITTDSIKVNHRDASVLDGSIPPLTFYAGRCVVEDKSLSVSAIYDRAAMAKDTVKGRYDVYVATYDETMRQQILKQQSIISQMKSALESGQFETWLQPQFNHATGMLSGAEALVRWRHPKDGIIPPNDFIPIFERNGFVYEVDKFVWEQTCQYLRKWLDQGLNPVPVSVNISRYDVFRDDLIDVITGLVKKYDLPVDLLRLEITESAFSKSADQIIRVVKQLVELGFTVEIDDFGSGYSSLNTLKDVPAQVLKMDMRFIEGKGDLERGGNIVESVIRMARWLNMSVIAEGVETVAQADYLRSIGCENVQGYLYSRPTQIGDYEKLFGDGKTESQLGKLQTLETWNNSAFWNPESMESLIFNSYVGGACIFEYHNGKTEILRTSKAFRLELGGLVSENYKPSKERFIDMLDEANHALLHETVRKAATDKTATSCEIVMTRNGRSEYIRATVRLIATAADRLLFYGVIQNMTEQRVAERMQLESAQQLEIIMGNISGGIAALNISDDGHSEIVFANERYYEIFGCSSAQAIAEHLDVMSLILPEDFPAVVEKVNQLKKNKVPIVIDYRCKRRDGKLVYVRENCAIMYMDGHGDVITSVLMDITEHRELDDKFKAVVENINGGISATYLQGDKPEYVIVNDRYYDVIGYTREQFEAEISNVFDIIHPDDRARVEEQFKEASVHQGKYTMEYRIVCHDGAIRHILCNTNVIRLFGIDEPVQLAVSNDITELRMAQEKERNASAQLRAITANINGGITATVFHNNDNIEIIFANDGFYAMYGYTKEQWEAEVPSTTAPILLEDLEKTMKTVARIVRDRGSETYEYRCRKRDGSIMWTQTTNTVIHMDGVDGIVLLAITTDVTALHEAQKNAAESEGKLRAVLDHAGNGITAIALRGEKPEFLFANDRYFGIIGYTRGEYAALTDSNMFALVYDEDRERMREIVTGISKMDKSATVEYRVRRMDGKLVWVRVVITITELPGIDVPVQIAIFSDITEEKEAADQLRFLNISAHDILAQPDSERAISDTLQKLMAYFAADRGYVVELDHKKMQTFNTYEVCADGATSEKENLQALPFTTSDYWYEKLAGNEYFTIEDVSGLDDSNAELRQHLSAQGIRSMILAPIMRNGVMIAFAGVDNPTKAMQQIGSLTAVSDYLAVLLTRRDLNQKIESDAVAMKRLVDDTPGGFCRMRIYPDRNPSLVSMNGGFCHMLGMTEQEVLDAYGEDMYRCLSLEDIAGATQDSAEAVAAEGQFSTKCRLRQKGDTFLWTQVFGRFVSSDDGNLYLNSYFTDITAEKQAEEQQKELLDNLPQGAALYRYDGEHISVVHINKRYWELVGRQPVDYKTASVIGVIHPEDRLILNQEIRSALTQKRNLSAHVRILNGSGDYTPFYITASYTKEADGKYLFYTSYEVIADHTMSVQELITVSLSTMLSTSSDIAYLKDRDLRYVFCSQALADMVGAESPRDIIGKTADDLFEKKYADQFNEEDARIIATGKSVVDAAETIPGTDGSTHLSSTSKYPIIDADGNVYGVYCVSRDVTSLRQAQSQLELLTSTLRGGLAAYAVMPDGVKALYFNDAYYDFSGCTREEYVAMTANDPLAFMLEEDRPGFLAVLREIIAGKTDGATANSIYRCRTKSGEIRWMSMSMNLTAVGDGQFVLNAVQLDVTEQKVAGEKQRELLDNLPCGAALYEFDGKTITALHINRQYEILTGRSVNSANTDMKPTDYIHPEDRLTTLNAIRDGIAENRNAFCDIRVLYGEREYRTFHIDARIEKEQSGKYLIYATYFHIPEHTLSLREMLPVALSAIMKTSPDMAYVKDRDLRYIGASSATAKLTGRADAAELIGKTDYELFGKELGDKYARDDRRVMERAQSIINDHDVISAPDGIDHEILSSKYPVFDANGSVVGLYGISRDVTQVRKNESQLKLLSDSIPGGIASFEFGPDGLTALYFNDGFYRSSGYSPEEYAALTSEDPFALIHKEDRPKLMALMRKQAEAQDVKLVLECDCRCRLRDGSYRWHSIRGRISNVAKDTFTINAALFDINERKTAEDRLRIREEEYRLAAQMSSSVICRYSIADSTVTIAADIAKRNGLPEVLEDVPYGRVRLGRISPHTADDFIAFYESIRNGEKEGSVTYQKLLPKGWRWFTSRFKTVFDSDGKPVSAVVSFTDVTEQREKELAYTKWRQMLLERPEDSYTLFSCNIENVSGYDKREGKLLNIVFDPEAVTFDERTEQYVRQCVFEDDRGRISQLLSVAVLMEKYRAGSHNSTIEFREKVSPEGYRWLRLTVDLMKSPTSDAVEAHLLFEDIDEQKRADLLMLERSETDPLTGVLNRTAFITGMETVLRESKSGEQHALFMLDVDNFKQVNDTLGHDAGDHVLRELTKTIRATLRQGDLIGRLGGDEFFFLLVGVPDREVAERKAKELCAHRFGAAGSDIAVTASMGVAMVPSDGADFDTLYKKVDAALYRQKARGKNGYLFVTE